MSHYLSLIYINNKRIVILNKIGEEVKKNKNKKKKQEQVDVQEREGNNDSIYFLPQS
jgi:hypothetical protein